MMFLIKNLNLFLDKRLKINFLIYFICLFVASFLETIGISIIPIIISLYLKEGFFYEKLPDYIINYAAQGEGAASWKNSWRYFETNSMALAKF